MPRDLSLRDVAGAISELVARQELHTGAIAQLAGLVGFSSPARDRTYLSDTEELEVLRLTAAHPTMLRQEAPVYPEGDFRESSAAAEILRLTATHPREFGAVRPTRSGVSRSGRPSARARRDSELLSLSRTTASPADGQLVSKWGLPVTVAGQPVTTENSERLGLGRVLPPLVRDVTDSPSEDYSSYIGRPTGGLGNEVAGLDPSDARVPDARPTNAQVQAMLDQQRAQGMAGGWDLGPDVSGFGEQTDEVSNPYAVANPAAEVNRLVKAGAAAGITGLRTGAKKARHPATGRFTSKQAKLTGTLSGPV